MGDVFKPSSPEAPDPVDVESLIELMSQLNRVNTTTPLGGVTFSGGDPIFEERALEGTPGVPRTIQDPRDPTDPNARIANPDFVEGPGGTEQVEVGRTPIEAAFEFSPEVQALFDQAITPFTGTSELDFSLIDPVSSIGDFDTRIADIEDAFFERQRRLLDPAFAAREEAIRTRNIQSGIPDNTEAASGEFGNLALLERERNRSLENAALNAVLAGGAEESRILGEGRATRGQQINDQLTNINLALTERGRGFNELASLLGLTPAVTPQVPMIDVMGPTALNASQQQQQFNAQLQAQAAKKGGLTDIGSALLIGGGASEGGIPGIFKGS